LEKANLSAINKNLKYNPNVFTINMYRVARALCKEYRDRILEGVLHKKIIKPWMRYKEIEIIEEILKNQQPSKCLEWGCGYSTLHFPRFLKKSAKWISVEHEKIWASKIRSMNQNPRVEIYHIQPNNSPWTDKYQDGDYSDLRDYIEFPSKYGKFDFILIDGRARKHCLFKTYNLLENHGVVILHDANRKYYHKSFKPYKNQVLLVDYRKHEGGLWVGSKKRNLKKLFDVKRHKSLWLRHNEIKKCEEKLRKVIKRTQI